MGVRNCVGVSVGASGAGVGMGDRKVVPLGVGVIVGARVGLELDTVP
jgi:hypothetical protein